MKRLTVLLIFIVINLTLNAQYVKVMKDGVNIRGSASTKSQIICKSNGGDIFMSDNFNGEWYSIKIGSGKEKRYIHKSTCETVTDIPSLPDLSTCKKIFLDFRRAEKKAQDSADSEVSPSSSNYVKRLIATEAIYFSKHTMQVFHKYKIVPALYGEIVDLGIDNNWININLY